MSRLSGPIIQLRVISEQSILDIDDTVQDETIRNKEKKLFSDQSQPVSLLNISLIRYGILFFQLLMQLLLGN
jgi:hypothetical protein